MEDKYGGKGFQSSYHQNEGDEMRSENVPIIESSGKWPCGVC